tara:strand:- start:851 stop:1627 length:777 start_codon:yes stop_codon:yes gene_type:complete
MDEDAEMSPEEFFDALDKFFGQNDGYKNHLCRIYGMKDNIASLQVSEAKCESQIEHLHQTRMELVNDAHKDLIDRVEELMKENEKLTDDIDDAVENHFADLKLRETTHKEWDTLEEENEKLKAENEKLNDNDWVIDNHKALKYKIILTEEYYAELTSENEELKEDLDHMGIERADNTSEIEKLFKFITGGGEMSDVEEIIRGKMSKEFIDSNQEHWDQMELFQEESRWDYKDDEVDYYVNGERKVVLKDGRWVRIQVD